MNKKKIRISTAIPASLSEFETGESANPHLTSATLKVFHTGKTVDNRVITQSLANKIKETIGGTPIVARYDEEAEDFQGHYYSQSVFGFVPENPDVRIEKDHYGNEWLITNVKLFTEREDVGRIAKKIIGQAQSLELNPETIEYNLRYEEGSEQPEIELINGDLIGLSVLGNEQNPAFAGSGFFEVSENRDLIKEMISKYNNIPTEILVETGGETMEDFKTVEKEKDEESANTDPILDEINEPEEPEEPETPEIDPEEEGNDGEEPDAPEVDEETVEDETVEPEEVVDDSTEGTPEGDADAGEAGFEEKAEEAEVGMEPEAEENTADTFALNKEEREELNNYRKEHKVRIVDSYAEYLSKEERQTFIDNIDNYEIDALEKEVAFVGMKSVKNNKVEDKQTTSFTFVPGQAEKRAKDDVGALINKYNN